MRYERKSTHRIGRALPKPPTESCDAGKRRKLIPRHRALWRLKVAFDPVQGAGYQPAQARNSL
jgi:hypothetical protein